MATYLSTNRIVQLYKKTNSTKHIRLGPVDCTPTRIQVIHATYVGNQKRFTLLLIAKKCKTKKLRM